MVLSKQLRLGKSNTFRKVRENIRYSECMAYNTMGLICSKYIYTRGPGAGGGGQNWLSGVGVIPL